MPLFDGDDFVDEGEVGFTFDVPNEALNLNKVSPFRLHANGSVQGRGGSGRFGSIVNKAVGSIGPLIKEELKENYRRLGIGSNSWRPSGTLYRALDQAEIQTFFSRDTWSIAVWLAPLERPARSNEPGPVSVRYYGPLVFKGRDEIYPVRQPELRYRDRGGRWVTRHMVGPGRAFDITKFSLDQWKKIISKLETQLRDVPASIVNSESPE